MRENGKTSKKLNDLAPPKHPVCTTYRDSALFKSLPPSV